MSTKQGEEVVNRGRSKIKFRGRRFHCSPLERRKRIAHRAMDTGGMIFKNKHYVP